MSTNPVEMFKSIQYMTTPAPDSTKLLDAFMDSARTIAVVPEVTIPHRPENMRKYLHKMENFETTHFEDGYLEQGKHPVLVSAFRRLDRVSLQSG